MLNIIMLSLVMLSVVTPSFGMVDGQNQTLDLQHGLSCWLHLGPLVGKINFKWLKKTKKRMYKANLNGIRMEVNGLMNE
jgi:hypothetical protein